MVLGSNAGDMLLNTLCLAREGKWNLFYFNFRGHADSEGHFTSLGPLELKDFESALTFLKGAKPQETRRLADLRTFARARPSRSSARRGMRSWKR